MYWNVTEFSIDLSKEPPDFILEPIAVPRSIVQENLWFQHTVFKWRQSLRAYKRILR